MQPQNYSREENFSFWKNILLFSLFFTAAPVTLLIALFSLLTLKNNTVVHVAAAQENLITTPQSGVRVFASLPVEAPKVESSIESADARPEIIRNYLEKYKSPMLGHEKLIVTTADKYSLDFRLITAIAQQESNVCKIIPPDSYNCWGWGIHSRGSLGFQSYEEGIETVSNGLRQEYLNKGYTTVEEIMSKYTPSSPGTWARGVNQFMGEME